MNTQNYNGLEKSLEIKIKKRDKKKIKKMKVSGASVKGLQKLIERK